MTTRTALPPARDTAKLWRLTILLAAAGLACAILLGGLSAWFLGSVAIAGLSAAALTFNFHVPAAFVRLFALGRTATRYGERLLGHQAALTDQTSRRIALFAALARGPAARAAGWQLADPARLADYLDDVEDLDFARLRTDLPARLLLAGLAVAAVATAFLAPLALAPIALLIAVATLSLRRLLRAGKACWQAVRDQRREGAEAFGRILQSVVPLQAEGTWAERCGAALDLFSQAEDALAALRLEQARTDALAFLLGPGAAVSVMAAAWISGARGAELLVPAFLAFSWLALGEAAQSVSRMAVAALRRKAAQAQIEGWAAPGEAGADANGVAPVRITHLHRHSLRRRAPDGRPLGDPLFIELKAGRPTLLVGPSGVGKTSLLKQIAGWIGDDALTGQAGPLGSAQRAASAMLCPHDAAILADTVRANLFAPGRSDAELWQALEAMELAGRIREAGGLGGWITQDALSLGEAQRLNLARAWLSDKSLVLLDEPTEHLDARQGRRILARLLERLQDRVVVLSSHGIAEWPGSVTLRL